MISKYVIIADQEYEKSKNSCKKLQTLHDRLSKLKIFDPACGSGNFLIIAYKELRKLEIKILKQLNGMSDEKQLEFELFPKREQQSFIFLLSEIKLSQFYGIELDDFAHEVAMLSLWLAEHQMNMEFFKELGQTNPPLPLQDGGNIVYGNATRIDWEEVCPKEDGDEIYVLGNPPYLGFKMQDINQKNDMKIVFESIKNYKKLDYIACWFFKGANYIKGFNAQYAFVSTNSISQGEQVGILWSHILKDGLEIDFAHQSFKWQNNAKGNAGVTVVVIGFRNQSILAKYLYQKGLKQEVKNINAYLVNAYNIIVQKTSKPISNLPKMQLGNMPKDDGNLILSDDEKNKLVITNPECKPFIKKLIGVYEFLNGSQRWCFWIKEDSLKSALSIELIRNRVKKVENFRLASTDKSANKMAETPFKFREQHEANSISIIIPTVTSERREYIPMGYLGKESIVVAPNNVLYDPESYVFGILSSKLHILWVKAVGGKLETRIRYSSVLCYNTFPFPDINEKQKELLTTHVFKILEEREKHSEKTPAQLYDPDKMPEGLKKAHHELDLAIERCYRSKPFTSDEERLEYLFGLYEEMIREENKK